MEPISPLSPDRATGMVRELYEVIYKKHGMIPNMMKIMGNSPSVLDGYLSFSNALARSSIGARLFELIALAVSARNNCHYCMTAHSFIAAAIYEVEIPTIQLAKQGKSNIRRIQTVLDFVVQLIDNGGKVPDFSLDVLKREGFDQMAIVEIIACVSLITFTNLINNIALPEVDFPDI